jgi:hypothetical protein
MCVACREDTGVDLRLVACLPENSVPEVVHLDVHTGTAANLLPFFPNDLAGTEEDLVQRKIAKTVSWQGVQSPQDETDKACNVNNGMPR